DRNIQHTNGIIGIGALFSDKLVPGAFQIHSKLMGLRWLELLFSQIGYVEVLTQSSQELFCIQIIQILYHTIVVEDLCLACRKNTGDEVVERFTSRNRHAIISHFLTDLAGRCSPMVTVCYICGWQFFIKEPRN